MAYYGSRETSVRSGASAEYARVTRVSPDFFRVFAVEPILGRLFTSDEMKRGSGGALLISHAYWQSRLGGDAGALARSDSNLTAGRFRLPASSRQAFTSPTTQICGPG